MAVTPELRSTTFGPTVPLTPPMLAASGVITNGPNPFEYREPLSTFIALAAGQTTTTPYELPSLADGANAGGPAGHASALITATFQAQPFYDAFIGKNFVRARWYDQRAGAWLTPDPEGYGDSANMYAFCGGDPINCTDPTGLWGWKDAWTTVKSVGGMVVGVAESTAVALAHAGATPLIRATDAAVDAYTQASVTISAYRTGGLKAVSREAEIARKQKNAEDVETLKSLIPFRNTVKQAGKVIETYERDGSFAGGRQVGRTTFSAGLDAAVIYGAVKSVYERVPGGSFENPYAPDALADMSAIAEAEAALVPVTAAAAAPARFVRSQYAAEAPPQLRTEVLAEVPQCPYCGTRCVNSARAR